MVLKDVLEGWVSYEKALAVSGVVLAPVSSTDCDGLAQQVIRQDADEDCAWAVEVLNLHLEQMADR